MIFKRGQLAVGRISEPEMQRARGRGDKMMKWKDVSPLLLMKTAKS